MKRLGIEIGGTKLQLGIGTGDGRLLTLMRRPVDAAGGAESILRTIQAAAHELLLQHQPRAVGVGFGGPVRDGVVRRSHQVLGWEGFPLRQWCEQQLGLPAAVSNDCDAAALAEAQWGAAADCRAMFYVTVGTGVGGGLVVDGRRLGEERPAVAEIGHLRPGLQADRPEQTVESVASGWGIAAEAAARVRGDLNWPLHHLGESTDPARRKQEIRASEELADEYREDLLGRCGGDLQQLTCEQVAAAAADGNQLAEDCLQHGFETLGWAIAQAVTLTAPEVVVVGGGVSLLGEARFFRPLRAACRKYVFPPLADSFQIVPAALGEAVVVHGAIALAAELDG